VTERTAIRFELVILALALVGSMAYLARMLSYPARAGTVPAIVAVVTIVAIVVELTRVMRSPLTETASGGEREASGDVTELDAGGAKRLGLVVAWILLLFAAILGLGFVVGPGLMGFILMRIERESWTATAIVTGLLVAVAYLLMVVVLRAPVIDGVIFEWLGLD
jgi:hypothetical protein